jgi:hypothetical protein
MNQAASRVSIDYSQSTHNNYMTETAMLVDNMYCRPNHGQITDINIYPLS